MVAYASELGGTVHGAMFYTGIMLSIQER